ncbi:MAG: YARHG domain-containing protein [Mucilaginibacter sp.]
MKFSALTCSLLAIIFLQSCGGDSMIKNKGDDHSSSPATGHSKVPVPVATANLIVKDVKDLNGYWVGDFGPEVNGADTVMGDGDLYGYDKINISIDEIKERAVKGHIVMGGKVDFFSCNMEKTGNRYQFKFKESDKAKTHGTYSFSIAEGDSLLKGNWSEKADTDRVVFELTKKQFNYNAMRKVSEATYVDFGKGKKTKEKLENGDVYDGERYATTSEGLDKLNASVNVLVKDDLVNLKKADLLVLRNSIFARHGYTFKKPLLNLFFSAQSWYIPLSTDVTAQLTPVEKKNLELMKPYEKNAQEYYNAFGR